MHKKKDFQLEKEHLNEIFKKRINRIDELIKITDS